MNERWNEMDDVDLSHLEAEMRGELQDLREAATVYASRAWARGEREPVTPRETRPAWPGWAAAGAAAAMLVAGGAHLLQHQTAPGFSTAASAGAAEARPIKTVSDETLLDQIQSDLSSGVPAAMEPLQASSTVRDAQDVVKQ